eukprot:CAMPEP_0118889864 /NCGR_PEP_ID=MMETSP1166-20130328/589_1 /TAXON_ID=1104430 /ORGANISM="Chrysoreinhardia sp, Strain CCMP3193" /LENGTH=623 /DNA_ID=CAMNT_0006828461 /DNA_START=135 /DNA_END=2006 /DNA_ORIENTATION=+
MTNVKPRRHPGGGSLFGRVVEVLYGEVSYDEMPRIMWLSALLCAIIGGFWLLDSLKDTVLATTVGLEYQPRAKLLSVCVTLVVVSAYNALIDRVSKPWLFYAVGSFYATLFVILGGFLAHRTYGMENTVPDPSRYLGWITYFAIESYGSLAVALFWAFTNASVDLEDAKSSYGLIVAFAQVGAIVGSTLATQARSLHVSFLFVLGGCSCLMVCVMVRGYVFFFEKTHHTGVGKKSLASPTAAASSAARGGQKKQPFFSANAADTSLAVADDDDDDDDYRDEEDDGDDPAAAFAVAAAAAAGGDGLLAPLAPLAAPSGPSAPEPARKTTRKTIEVEPSQVSMLSLCETRFFDGFGLVLRHPYVAYLLVISTLYEVVLTVLDFEMKITGRARYGTDTRGAEEFAGLMGNFGQFVNTISFLFALGGFSFVVRKLGLPTTLLVFPTLLVVATLVAYAFPSLWTLFVTTAILKALTYSLNEPALEMLYMPTSDAIKFKAKAWIDVVGARSAKAVGSAINDVVQRSPYLRDNLPQYGNVPGFLIAIVLLVVSIRVGNKFDALVDDGVTVGDDYTEIVLNDGSVVRHRRAGKDNKGTYELVQTRKHTVLSEDIDDDRKNIFQAIAQDDNR